MSPHIAQMCGRFSQLRSWADLVRLYRITETAAAPNWPPRYNIAPTQPVAVVRSDRERGRRLETMRWGLVPAWAKDVGIGARMINARAESLAEKPAFRDAIRRRRCLIPADGFYEWRKLEGGGKQPYLLSWPADDPPPAFAALWERWRNPADGTWLLSCTIVTTKANAAVRPLHDRMPVLLEASAQKAWLDIDTVGADAARTLLLPWDAARTEVRPVSSWVNAVAHEGPRCVEPPADDRAGLPV